jgi:hypothetical protein
MGVQCGLHIQCLFAVAIDLLRGGPKGGLTGSDQRRLLGAADGVWTRFRAAVLKSLLQASLASQSHYWDAGGCSVLYREAVVPFLDRREQTWPCILYLDYQGGFRRPSAGSGSACTVLAWSEPWNLEARKRYSPTDSRIHRCELVY